MNKEIVLKVLSIFPKLKEILENKNITIEEKSGIGNIVTSIDKKLEICIKTSLNLLFPNAELICEESAENLSNINADLKFIIDPLDGTTNYTNGWPHTISIGIVQTDELIGGIIYDVLQNKIYTGIKDFGVTECNINNISQQIKVKVPKYIHKHIKKSPICYDTPYGSNAYKITQAMCSELYYAGASLKTVGPISLDVLKTALSKENRPSDYNAATWHSEVRAWDLAAATCILRELGGEIIGKDGIPLSIQTLSSPTEKIFFIASGNHQLRSELYEKYTNINSKITF